MRRSKGVRFLTFGVVLGSLSVSALMAEDTKGKWQFGFGLSYFSTMDYIRSNADIALSEVVVGDREGLPPVQSVDERPDINILNEPSINDDFKLDFTASYGLTRWLAVELAAGYLKAPVGDIEFYFKDQQNDILGTAGNPTGNQTCGPDSDKTCYDFNSLQPFDVKFNSFLPVGTITEIPVQLSALARFRPESPLDPYIGLGIGYIFTDLKTSPEFGEKAALVDSLFVSTADKGDFTRSTSESTNCGPDLNQPCNNFNPGPITATVKNAFQWHAVGGVDYYVNERFAFYVDARYVWTSGGVQIRTDGFPQVQLTIAEEGRLITLRRGSDSQPYLWEDTGVMGRYGVQDGLFATEDKFGGIQNRANDSEDVNNNGVLDVVPNEDRNNNGVLDFNDDDGILLLLPPNTRDLAEAVDTFGYDQDGNRVEGADGEADYIFCPECFHNGSLETEDRNANTFMDTHLLYGIDICTFRGQSFVGIDGTVRTPETTLKCFSDANGNGRWDTGEDSLISNTENFLLPSGCARIADQVTLDFGNLNVKSNVGCPPIVAGSQPVNSSTGTDDAFDVYIVQGGNIKLGGFSLGFGFKFLF
jgi:outer membrane protein W